MRLMENDQGITGPVNMGNPSEFTITELAKKILNVIPEMESRLVFRPLLSDDPAQRRLDISLAEKRLDSSPKIPLEERLTKTIDYFRRKLRSA